MNSNTMELNLNEMELAAGGNFLPNRYTDLEYGTCGIKVIHHTILFDEFLWQGENLGSTDAEKIMKFAINNGRQPYTLKEAKEYYWRTHQDIDF